MNLQSEKKYQLLKEKVKALVSENVVIAFSGGVDSSLLLKMACEFAKEQGTIVYAVTAHTKLHPVGDLEIAKKVAKEAGAVHQVLTIDELKEAGIENNPKDRCYLCKHAIFSKMLALATELGVKHVIEGTNEDDLHVYRPGIKALQELKINSPLAECGITKEEVRILAAEYGVSVANRPSSPCLATRLPYGAALSYELLARVDKGESYLRQLGFYNVRLRIHGEIARLEVDRNEFDAVLEKREAITAYLKSLGFLYITLDLEGFRSGSMDIGINKEKI